MLLAFNPCSGEAIAEFREGYFENQFEGSSCESAADGLKNCPSEERNTHYECECEIIDKLRYCSGGETTDGECGVIVFFEHTTD